MNRPLKKVLAIVTIVIMLISMFPSYAFAGNEDLPECNHACGETCNTPDACKHAECTAEACLVATPTKACAHDADCKVVCDDTNNCNHVCSDTCKPAVVPCAHDADCTVVCDVYEFKADGTGVYTIFGDVRPFTYAVDGNSIDIVYYPGTKDESEDSFEFELDGDSLTITTWIDTKVYTRQ